MATTPKTKTIKTKATAKPQKAVAAVATPIATKTAVPTKKAAAPKPKKTIPSIEFKVCAPGASKVFLAGDFNEWNTSSLKMQKSKGDIFKKSMKLKPGRYEYLFLVDGSWWTDPESPEKCSNPYHGENSIITVS
ncbi:MAG: glycogen-binding domain-containing protein [Proteobacteria bacterium]|nr:glycogen-binding domain-containing protein [Pseudomonadota bacterium]MBU1709923.1 glycogen-binding domain-containing protein [Pseudomonadota bacterium]